MQPSQSALQLAVEDRSVSAIWRQPANAGSAYVFAHGAGAGMHHAFMGEMAEALATHRVATLRFQFPFMEDGGRRPDRPAVAQATIRAAVARAAKLAPSLPLFAGGKSFGGRMTSQAQADMPLPDVCGLVFLGFPLHPANKPSVARAAHLAAVDVPMLFVQGSRDALANPTLLRDVLGGLGTRATLHMIEDADHAFKVPARTGRSAGDVIGEIAGVVADWCRVQSDRVEATAASKT